MELDQCVVAQDALRNLVAKKESGRVITQKDLINVFNEILGIDQTTDDGKIQIGLLGSGLQTLIDDLTGEDHKNTSGRNVLLAMKQREQR